MRTLLISFLGAVTFALPVQADTIIADWEYDALYNDWRITRIMEGAAVTNNGKKIGEVHDVILNESGLVDSVVIEQGDPNGVDWVFFEVPWADVDFQPAINRVRLEMDEEQVKNFARKEIPDFADANEFEASNLLGMAVNLDGARPFGEVDDLMINEGANDVSAYVVESDGPGCRLYALPADFGMVKYEVGLIDMPYVVDDVMDLDYFITS